MKQNKKSTICPICGGKIKKGKTVFTVDLKENLLVIRNVPARICSQCGEEWINPETSKKIEQMVNEAKTRKTQFEVINLS